MLLNCPPGKDLPALAALAAQKADDAQDAGEGHLCQPGEEVARGGDGVLLLPLPRHIGVALLGCYSMLP